MRTATAGFTAAIGTADTEPVTVVSFAWPPALSAASGYSNIPDRAVAGFGINIDLTTDINAETRLITGYPARGGTLTLAGMVGTDESQSVQWLFDPYSTTSPLFGLDWTGPDGPIVVVWQGLMVPGAAGPETISQGIFIVDMVQVDRATGTVILTLLDGRGKLTAAPSLPLVIANATSAYANIAPGLNASWVIDYILRKNGIYSGPPPRPGCVWYSTLHGSAWPEVGTVSSSSLIDLIGSSGGFPIPPTWTANGRWATPAALSYAIEQVNYAGITWAALDTAGYTITIEGSVYVDPAWVGGAGDAVFNWYFLDDSSLASFGVQGMFPTFGGTPGDLWVTTVGGVPGGRGGTPSPTPPNQYLVSGGGWHDIMYQYTSISATSWKYSIWIDGVQNGPYTCTGAATFVSIATGNANMNLTGSGSGTNLRHDTIELAVGEVTPAPTHHPWAAGQVTIDLSLNDLTAMPPTQATDVWGLMQEIASAEFATFGQDEAGVFYYRIRTNQPTTPATTVTSLTQVSQLQISLKEASRARTIQANVHPLGVIPPAVIWTVDHAVTVPPGGTVTVFASLQNPATLIPAGFIFTPSGGLVAPFSSNGYRAARKVDGTGGTVNNLTITATQLDAQTALIKITNPNAYAVWLVNPTAYTATAAGTPTLSLVGTTIGQTGPTDTAGNPLPGGIVITSVYGDGHGTLALPDNVWRQTPGFVQALTDAMLSETVHPKPLIDQFTILGDPRLQIGDRIRVQDQGERATNGFGPPAVLDSDIIITGLHPMRDAGFTQQITARIVGLPRQWVLGQVGKSELGISTWI